MFVTIVRVILCTQSVRNSISMKFIVLLVTTSSCLVNCLPPPHPDVEAVRLEEELLPPHLRSPALHNPHLQEILPLTSLLHNGEQLVFNREAHKVSRKEIYNILTHAGFISRQYLQRHSPRPAHSEPAIPYDTANELFYNPPYLQRQDYLQHL